MEDEMSVISRSSRTITLEIPLDFDPNDEYAMREMIRKAARSSQSVCSMSSRKENADGINDVIGMQIVSHTPSDHLVSPRSGRELSSPPSRSRSKSRSRPSPGKAMTPRRSKQRPLPGGDAASVLTSPDLPPRPKLRTPLRTKAEDSSNMKTKTLSSPLFPRPKPRNRNPENRDNSVDVQTLSQKAPREIMCDDDNSDAKSVSSSALDSILVQIKNAEEQIKLSVSADASVREKASHISHQKEMAGLIEKLASAAVAIKGLEDAS